MPITEPFITELVAGSGAQNNILYVVAYNNQSKKAAIYFTKDDGTSWQTIAPPESGQVKKLIVTDNYLYVAFTDNFYIYDGSTWTKANAGLSHLCFEDLALRQITL